LRRTASFDVLSVKIGLRGRAEEPKSVVNFEQEGVYFTYMKSKNPWADWA